MSISPRGIDFRHTWDVMSTWRCRARGLIPPRAGAPFRPATGNAAHYGTRSRSEGAVGTHCIWWDPARSILPPFRDRPRLRHRGPLLRQVPTRVSPRAPHYPPVLSCLPLGSAAKNEPPPTVATIGGGSRFGDRPTAGHAAGRISPGAGFVSALLRGVASTLLALSHAASSSASFMKR